MDSILPFPRSVLQKPENEGLGLEDTDVLQTELETLLSAVAKRMRQLEADIQSLSSTADKNGKGGDADGGAGSRPVTPSKGNKKGGKVVSLPRSLRENEQQKLACAWIETRRQNLKKSKICLHKNRTKLTKLD